MRLMARTFLVINMSSARKIKPRTGIEITVPRDVVAWSRAADFYLGTCYEQGSASVAKDEQKAAAHYQRAADLGHRLATFNLAHCFHNGTGVARDERKAVKLFRRAADWGDQAAMFCLGMYLKKGGATVSKNAPEAVRLFRRASEKGHFMSAHRLGRCYLLGCGVTADKEAAIVLFQRAAAMGSDDARLELAALLLI
jgi:TPR repeat protein